MGATMEPQCKGHLLLAAVHKGRDDDLIMQNNSALQHRSALALSRELTGCSNTRLFLLPEKQCTAATDTDKVSVPQVSVKSKLITSSRRASIFNGAKTQTLIISNL